MNVDAEEGWIYDYTKVLGASKRVKMFKQRAKPAEFTKEQFMVTLRAGDHYAVKMPRTGRCKPCGGFGKVSGAIQGTKSGNVRCPTCRGTGKARGTKLVKVVLK